MRKRLYNILHHSNSNELPTTLYDGFMIIIIIISIIPLCFKELNNLLIMMKVITGVIFIIDYLLRWITADLAMPNHGYRSFIYYPLTPFALIDLLSLLAPLTLLIFMVTGSQALILFPSTFLLLRLFRLFQALRILKMLRYSKNFFTILEVLHREKQSLLSVCYIVVGYVIISALIMFSVEPHNFDSFFDAVYWAATVLTTVGYGDIHPLTNLGKLVSIVSSLLGIAVVALPAGIITAGYFEVLNEKKK